MFQSSFDFASQKQAVPIGDVVDVSRSSFESPAFPVLGIQINAIQIPQVIARIEQWIAERNATHYIAVTGMHGVMVSHYQSEFAEVLAEADLVVPDGMPLIWIGRHRGFVLARRVYGPELMWSFCEKTAQKKYRHFFYGGGVGVADALANRFAAEFPGLVVAGKYTPPFRPLTKIEDEALVSQIESARPDVLWVGLSTPKQETWMRQHRDRLQVPVMIGVGAAFDFHAGRVPKAPAWMGNHGLEWLFRLVHEPSRLWRRYLGYGPVFIGLVAGELLGLRKFGAQKKLAR